MTSETPTRQTLAAAYEQVGNAYLVLAHALRGNEQPGAGGASAAPPRRSPAPADEYTTVTVTNDDTVTATSGRPPYEQDRPPAVVRANQRAATALKPGDPCPVHGDTMRDGNYGLFCPNGAFKDQTGKWCKGRGVA